MGEVRIVEEKRGGGLAAPTDNHEKRKGKTSPESCFASATYEAETPAAAPAAGGTNHRLCAREHVARGTRPLR